jgi:hypothetical protein
LLTASRWSCIIWSLMAIWNWSSIFFIPCTKSYRTQKN